MYCCCCIQKVANCIPVASTVISREDEKTGGTWNRNSCPNRKMRDGRNCVPMSGWDGNNWADSIGMGPEKAGNGNAAQWTDSGMGPETSGNGNTTPYSGMIELGNRN